MTVSALRALRDVEEGGPQLLAPEQRENGREGVADQEPEPHVDAGLEPDLYIFTFGNK